MDFRLKVFHSVACNLSFTKASRELFISQPAISKHIHELEVQYKTPLFERTGSQIRLTRAGELLFSHTHSLLASYRQLDFGGFTFRCQYDNIPICSSARACFIH